MSNIKVPLVAQKHVSDLTKQQKQFEKIIEKQMGVEVLEFFGELRTAVINPSSIGIGVLERMVDTDDTISSALEYKTLMILSKIGEYEHEDKDIKDFVNRFLKRMKGPTWQQSLEGQLTCYGFGFSVSEIVWGLNRDYQKVPVKIPTYHPKTICFEMDREGIAEDGVLQFVSQFNQDANPNSYYPEVKHGWTPVNPFTTPWDRQMAHRVPFINNFYVVRIPRKKVIHHVSRAGVSFGSPYGKTVVRTAHLLWQLKNFFLKHLGIGGKRAGSPTLWAQAPKSGQNVEFIDADGQKKQMSAREAVISMLSNLETSDSIVTGSEKDGWGVKVLQNAINLGSYTDVINALDVWIFRCFLLPSLVMTDGSAGSRSLGDKHFESVDMIAETEAINVTNTIINDLIEPAIVENFGIQESYGSFNKRAQSTDELQKFASIYANLVNSGIVQSYVLEDLNHIRGKLGLPPAKDASHRVEQSPYGEI